MKKKIILIFLIFGLFNNAYSGPVIIVKGTPDSLNITDQVSKLLQHLDIHEDIYLIITFSHIMPGGRYGYALCREVIPLYDSINYKVIKVGIKSTLSGKLLNKVLAHEMIHVKQYAKEELIIENNHQVIWNGKNFLYEADEEAILPPWEKEANNIKSLMGILERENGFYAKGNSKKENLKNFNCNLRNIPDLNPQLINSLAIIKKNAFSIPNPLRYSIYPENLPIMYQNCSSEKLLICSKSSENKKCLSQFKSAEDPI